MFKRLDHVEIIPSDYEKTKAFYIDLLGFRLKEELSIKEGPLDKLCYLTLGDSMIELLKVVEPIQADNPPMPVGYHGIALEVDDMEETVRYLQEKNIVITWGPVRLNHSIRAEIVDPDSLVIELRQWVK